MIHLLAPPSSPVLSVEFADFVGSQEHRRFLAVLRRAVRAHGRIDLLLDVSRLRAIDGGIVTAGQAFAATDPHAIRRLAVVGDHDWAAWVVVMAGRYLRTRPRWFRPADRALAEQFVQFPSLTVTS
ncbi:MAG: STAS/SEC14 domain-containing protein [Rhodothermales bacterium]